MLTEDRRLTGMFPALSLSDNLVSASGNRFGRWRWHHHEVQSAVNDAVKQFRVVCRDIEQPLLQLSGGNQQKVLLARWLINRPRLLILDEPTRGVDVAAKDEIHEWVKRLADGGMSVLFISSDLTEVLSLADNIFVLRDGQCVGNRIGATATEQQIMELASLGVEKASIQSARQL